MTLSSGRQTHTTSARLRVWSSHGEATAREGKLAETELGHCCMCFAALLFFNTTTKTLTDRSLLFEAQRITWY